MWLRFQRAGINLLPAAVWAMEQVQGGRKKEGSRKLQNDRQDEEERRMDWDTRRWDPTNLMFHNYELLKALKKQFTQNYINNMTVWKWINKNFFFYYYLNFIWICYKKIVLSKSCSSNRRSVAHQRSWVRFPGKARTDNNVYCTLNAT